MRLSELLGAEVVDAHGHTVGKVHDVRLAQVGPELEVVGPSLRVEGLIVGRRALGARLGFGRGGARGPWLLKVVFGALGHDGRYVAWNRIRSIGPRQIRITGTADDLPRPELLGRAPLHREPTEVTSPPCWPGTPSSPCSRCCWYW